VKADTREWRGTVDVVQQFIEDHLEFDPGSWVLATELFDEFLGTLRTAGNAEWNDQTFTDRFSAHELVLDHPDVKKMKRVRVNSRMASISRPHRLRNALAPSGQKNIWVGLRFRSPEG